MRGLNYPLLAHLVSCVFVRSWLHRDAVRPCLGGCLYHGLQLPTLCRPGLRHRPQQFRRQVGVRVNVRSFCRSVGPTCCLREPRMALVYIFVAPSSVMMTRHINVSVHSFLHTPNFQPCCWTCPRLWRFYVFAESGESGNVLALNDEFDSITTRFKCASTGQQTQWIHTLSLHTMIC